MQIGKDKNQELYDAPELEVRPCDHPGCRNTGEHRAPKGRERLRDYYWFCLDHVRDYNRAWNFYAGLSEAEVEQLTRSDTVWNRPSWPLGSWAAREEELRQEAARMAGEDPDAAAEEARRRWQRSHDPRTPRDDTETALAELDLTPPVAFETVKARYKTLVKRHHPDTNGGSKVAEEKLKSINRAYGVLKAAFGR